MDTEASLEEAITMAVMHRSPACIEDDAGRCRHPLHKHSDSEGPRERPVKLPTKKEVSGQC